MITATRSTFMLSRKCCSSTIPAPCLSSLAVGLNSIRTWWPNFAPMDSGWGITPRLIRSTRIWPNYRPSRSPARSIMASKAPIFVLRAAHTTGWWNIWPPNAGITFAPGRSTPTTGASSRPARWSTPFYTARQPMAAAPPRVRAASF